MTLLNALKHCIMMNLLLGTILKVHGPPQDENVNRKVHVSFLRKSLGDMIT
jgi:hypothetical protein